MPPPNSRPADDCDWFVCTPLGSRLSTLQAGYRMSFREKLEWIEEAVALASALGADRTIAPSALTDQRPPVAGGA